MRLNDASAGSLRGRVFRRAVKPAPVGNARQAVRHGHADGLEFVLHDTGQVPEGRNVLIREGAGNGVDQAQRAATVPSGRLTGWPA